MNGVNRGIFRLLPVFLLLFLGVSSCSQKEERRILVIHSYEETYAAYPEFNRMIAEQFEKEKIDADIRTVYLDCESTKKIPVSPAFLILSTMPCAVASSSTCSRTNPHKKSCVALSFSAAATSTSLSTN